MGTIFMEAYCSWANPGALDITVVERPNQIRTLGRYVLGCSTYHSLIMAMAGVCGRPDE